MKKINFIHFNLDILDNYSSLNMKLWIPELLDIFFALFYNVYLLFVNSDEENIIEESGICRYVTITCK